MTRAFLSQDHMTIETPADTAETGAASLADLLESRHQMTPDHETHREVGAAPQEPEPAPQPSAQPAPTAEIPLAPAAADTTLDPAAKPEKEQPFWYRKEIEKERKERQRLERELEQTRGRQAPQQQPQSDEDLDRPLTRREWEAHKAQDRLVTRLENSEERFIGKLGEETFEQTREWLATRPDIEEWALKQRDPWKAAHDQFNKERLASEIGEDPNAWRERERERLRQEILAEQQQQHQPAPAAAPQMRAAPPLQASTVRSAPPERDAGGRFTGQAPLSSLTKHKFG